MNTFQDIQNWVLNEFNDTSSAMRVKVKRYVNTILQHEYIGCDYSWNLQATTFSLGSGASSIALPSLMADYNKENFFNLTYSNPLVYGGKRRTMQSYANNGVVELYWRQGNNFVFPPSGAPQQIYFEWYPQFTSLVSNGDITEVPNKQIIAEGALWLAMTRHSKKGASDQRDLFFSMKQQLREDDNIELVELEDPDVLMQRG